MQGEAQAMGEAKRGSFGPRALRTLVALCAGFFGELTVAFFEADGESARQSLLGAATGYLLAFFMFVPSAPLLALFWSPVQDWLGREPVSRFRSVWARARANDLERSRARAAALLAASFSVGGLLLASYAVTLELVLAIARPKNAAALIALAHLALGAGATLLFVAARKVVHVAQRTMARLRKGPTWLDSPVHVAGLLFVLFAAALAAALYAARQTLEDAPFRVLLGPLVGMAAMVLTLVLLPRRTVRPAGLCCAALWLISWPAAFVVRPQDYGAIALFEGDVQSAKFASHLLTRALDRDGDGHRSVLGGGDCKPHDPSFHPGAPDIPDNGLDEDCDGRDLSIPALFADTPPPFVPVPESVPRRPHIVLITIDAFAAGHLRSFGYERNTAPNIERLIARGVLFERCFAQGPSTRLSFPSLFTSRYDSEIKSQLVGRLPYPLSSENTTLAELLESAGYRTAAVLPTQYFTKTAWPGLTQGFHDVDASATTLERGGPAFNAEKVTARAMRQLSARSPKPLFLWTHYYDAHAPHAVPAGMTVPGTSKQHVYDAELGYLDKHLGQLLQAIDRELGKDTLVILTGDHGYGFGGKRYARGGYGYDLNTVTLHVPLVFAGSFLKPARRHSLCSTLDVLPTVLNLVRGTSRAGLRGYSLVPELWGGRTTRPQLLFHQYFLPEKLWKNREPLILVGVRTPEHNYVLDRITGVASLWNWREDYREKRDLLRTGEAHGGVHAQLKGLASAFVYRALRDVGITKLP